MTNLNPDEPQKPIAVEPTAVPAQVGSGLRDLALVLTAVPAIISLLGRRDINEIAAYIQSAEFAQVIAILAPVAIFVWRQVIARRNHAIIRTFEKYVPNRIGFVKDKGK